MSIITNGENRDRLADSAILYIYVKFMSDQIKHRLAKSNSISLFPPLIRSRAYCLRLLIVTKHQSKFHFYSTN